MWRAKMQEFVDRPFEYVKESMKNGTAVPSFCSTLLDNGGASIDDLVDFDIRWTANSMYSASIDTTMTVVLHFFLAMVQNPGVLAKAQKEIDSVVGNDRLPTLDDRANLPYVNCVFDECLRWGVPVPLSLPHRLMEDDVFEGRFIPKGSLVFANVWNILRDESLFFEPHKFIPERYLEPVDEATAKRRDPKNFVFGFGRRVCPGRHLVCSSVWMLMATIMATLNISKPVDERGNTIEPEVVFDNSIFRMPRPFKVDIKPRSEKTIRVIRFATNDGSD
jgi:cytochrome P450